MQLFSIEIRTILQTFKPFIFSSTYHGSIFKDTQRGKATESLIENRSITKR